MERHSTGLARVTWILGGVALGAAAMYMMDPVQGNRRRALVRDKAYSSRVKLRKSINAKSRDLANRARGLQAEARHMLEKKDRQAGAQTTSPPVTSAEASMIEI